MNLAVGLAGVLFIAGGLLLHHYRPGVYIDAPHLLWAVGMMLIVSGIVRQARRVLRVWRARCGGGGEDSGYTIRRSDRDG